MPIDANELRNRATKLARHPRTRRIAIWFVAIVVAIGVLGGLVAPPLLRGKLAAILTDKLHRTVTIEQIRINPYAMSAAVRGFLMKERQSDAAAISFAELYVNIELQSIFRGGPVIKELRLFKPYVSVTRDENFKYNYQDLIDEFMSGPSGPTPRFALKNIEVIDGRIDFDDRPEQTKHTISNIKIGVPFVSSIPSQVDIKVQPAFSALIDGSPLVINGETKPFKDTLESQLHFNLDNLNIPKYLTYSPVDLNFKMPSGQIDGKLTATFRTARNKAATLVLSGNLAVQDLVLLEKNDAPLLKLPSLEVALDAIEVFAGKAAVKSVKVQAPELHFTMHRDGTTNLSSLVAVEKDQAETKPKQNESPFIYRVDEFLLDKGKLAFTDQSPAAAFKKQLDDIRVSVKGLTNEPEKQAATEISFQTDAKEDFHHSGTLQLAPLSATGTVELTKLRLNGLRPYYESVVALDIKEGMLDLTARFAFEQKQEAQVNLSEINAALRQLRMDMPGQSEPLWRVPLLAVKDAAVDVGKKSIVIGALECGGGRGFINRDADGTISYSRLFKKQAAETTKPAEAPATEWRVDTKRLTLDRIDVTFEDRSTPTPARIAVSQLQARGENLSNAKNHRGKVTISARINNKGSLRLAGTSGANPPVASFTVDARDIELLPFQPYLEDQVNFLLTGGQIGTKGALTFDASGDGPAKVNYEGSLQVTDFATIDKIASLDLLKWKALNLDGIQFALEPMQLSINEINLADFYSRLILGADGKMNLQKLTAQRTENKDALETKPEQPAEAPAAAPSSERRIAIGKINLQGGNVNFSDFFIKPNYTANLTGFQGTISELKPETPGDIEIHAKLDNAAPVDIVGKINPLAKDLTLDIKVDATDIELSPMSPYSGRYIGYGIEKGKLTFNVQYKIENRKLSAENKFVLNQLTFGDKVESPDATKLPVLLAVSLLKDRNGVIDINLPIGGSLDDPKFSVGGIVWQLILNILVKAVTSPFALLGAVFSGGSAEELSYIEFDAGRAALTQTARSKIAAVAKAMGDRPAVKLELSGRVDPATDLEGLKRVGIERKVKAQKLKELVRRGEAVKTVDDVRVEPGEYAQYLKAAYGDESFPKPRNLIGLARDLPVPEMEKLMLQHAKVSDDDLRLLANQRAQTVRDALLATKLAGADRLFIVAAKPLSAEEAAKIKAKPNRVDFTLK